MLERPRRCRCVVIHPRFFTTNIFNGVQAFDNNVKQKHEHTREGTHTKRRKGYDEAEAVVYVRKRWDGMVSKRREPPRKIRRRRSERMRQNEGRR